MIPLPKKPQIKSKEGNKATLVIEGLYPGYGLTVGNVLRRILLSSLEGAAITRAEVEETSHEFSTIPGVKEDGIMILLNLKRVKFKMFGDKERIEASLKAKGEGVVTADQFKLPSQLELVNKDQVIATLTDKKASLNIDIEVMKGIGYEPSERREKEEGGIGVVDLDAIYSPVARVAFKVEEMRVGKRTDFDRLILKIETDGRLEPEEAYEKAIEILQDQVSVLNLPKDLKIEKEKDLSDIMVSDLELPTRTISILEDNRVKSLAGLTGRSEDNIAGLDGIGPKSLQQIKDELKKRDLELL